MAMVTRWHDTSRLPEINDTGELPYLPVLCRQAAPATDAPESGEAGLMLALIVVGQGLGWMLVGAFLTRWL